MRLVFASRNEGKVDEMRALLHGVPIVLLTLDQAGVEFTVVEDQPTFEGNARKKSEEVCRATGLPTLADDSGLEVDLLDGAPGVRSARYAGEKATDAQNNARLLAALAAASAERPDAPRTARFRCCLALSFSASGPMVRTFVETGSCEGEILRAPRGDGGFGYDPLFFVPETGKTLAEMTMAEKNRVSHRGRAMRHMAERLRQAVQHGAWRTL